MNLSADSLCHVSCSGRFTALCSPPSTARQQLGRWNLGKPNSLTYSDSTEFAYFVPHRELFSSRVSTSSSGTTASVDSKA